MKFREMSQEMNEEEIRTLFNIVLPDAIFRKYQRMSDYIRVWYSFPNDKDKTKHRLDLLPDDVYFISDTKESEEMPLKNGNILHRYNQFMVAKGYSLVWKENPYAR